VGIETLGSYDPHALNFIKDIGGRIMDKKVHFLSNASDRYDYSKGE
jgi:hypothetical protein